MQKNVCVVSSTRADYGILKPLLKRIDGDAQINLRLVATGMHLSPEFGNTVSEITADGFEVACRIPILVSADTPAGMSKTMSMALSGFADYFESHTPDLLILLGDRYEIAAVACAALNQKIPIAHIHGGELTSGAIDDNYRHAITKMSSLHFTSCDDYRKRVIQLGESPSSVFNVGSMGVENVLSVPDLPLAEISSYVGLPLEAKKYAIVTFHPVTQDEASGTAQVKQLMQAMEQFSAIRFVVTKANSDAGGREINTMWEAF
ncbi:UDP-N-acetylglucosamine 2-epimerase, partial [Desulfovibrio sp. OttesenSCG-928-C06]|nr:UDP-N-acetylglucosamine 2-epimerase [Desulfovibrio sp. OttesenSCG-928-C06]